MNTFTFKEYLIQEEYNEFINFVQTIDNQELNLITEMDLSNLSNSLKQKIDFIKEMTSKTEYKLSELIDLFKDKKVFKFMKSISWSFKKLWKILKQGYKAYTLLISVITEFLAENKVIKWTDKQLVKLDDYLSNHPKLKRMSGIIIGALLAYIWFNVSFTGVTDIDFNMTDLISAIHGDFSLTDIFSGSNGITIILLLTGGHFALGFPWPGSSSMQFITSIIGSLIVRKHKK